MLNRKKALNLLANTTFESLGCTEPIAIALAVATAYNEIKGNIQKIELILDKNVYKNASNVYIPGTTQKGIKFASILALFAEPSKGLLLFEDVSKNNIKKAEELLKNNIVAISHDINKHKIFIEAKIITTNGYVKATIQNKHDNIVKIEKNGEILLQKETKQISSAKDEIVDFSIQDVIDILNEIKDEDLNYLTDYVSINLQAADFGLKQDPKMNIGAALKKILNNEDIFHKIKYTAAAAASSRMTGQTVKIIGCTGSGNHGITFFISVGLAYKFFKNKTQSLQKALAFGLIILSYIKQKTGLLAPMCGCSVAAGAAASGAIVYLLGGSDKQVLSSINLVIATLAGLVCDGAKNSCSMKIAASASVATESAALALNNISVCNEGITGNSPKDTTNYLAMLHSEGMHNMDSTILKIFSKKDESIK